MWVSGLAKNITEWTEKSSELKYGPDVATS